MNCDKCGLDDSECRCVIQELENRIHVLEVIVDGLVPKVNWIHGFLYENLEKGNLEI